MVDKVIIKPHPEKYGLKQIHQGGKPVGEYHFLRDRKDKGGRVEITHSGEHTDYESGKKHSLNMFAWEADVRKHLKNEYESHRLAREAEARKVLGEGKKYGEE